MANDSAPFRRQSIRLDDYDYSQTGTYFVTICADGNKNLFGCITAGKVNLNKLGGMVRDCWLEIPRHFPNVELDAFVVMPNHLHGILMIHRRARHAVPLQPRASFGKPVSGSLATIIGGFKSAVSKCAAKSRLGYPHRVWQRNYYEHIVRSGEDLDEIRRYIVENPAKWEMDSENPAKRL